MMIDIKPIRNDEDLNWALDEIEQYFDHPPQLGTPEADRYQLLGDLIEAYEEKHYPIDAPDPVAAIQEYMQVTGQRQTDLAVIVGGRGRASEIINKKRRLTLPMIQKIVEEWKMPAEILIRPYHLDDDEARPPRKASKPKVKYRKGLIRRMRVGRNAAKTSRQSA